MKIADLSENREQLGEDASIRLTTIWRYNRNQEHCCILRIDDRAEMALN